MFDDLARAPLSSNLTCHIRFHHLKIIAISASSQQPAVGDSQVGDSHNEKSRC